MGFLHQAPPSACPSAFRAGLRPKVPQPTLRAAGHGAGLDHWKFGASGGAFVELFAKDRCWIAPRSSSPLPLFRSSSVRRLIPFRLVALPWQAKQMPGRLKSPRAGRTSRIGGGGGSSSSSSSSPSSPRRPGSPAGPGLEAPAPLHREGRLGQPVLSGSPSSECL